MSLYARLASAGCSIWKALRVPASYTPLRVSLRPEVEAYGFVWEDLEPNAPLGDSDYKAGSDWMGETMWVALKDGSTELLL